MTSMTTHPVHSYDTVARMWRSEVETHSAPGDAVPALRGTLLADPAALAAASQDLGRIVRRRPGAILRPADIGDVEAMMAFCAARRIGVSARGEAHTTGGQGLTEGGLIIDMGSLCRIIEITPDLVEVEAGIQWLDLLRALQVHGLRVSCGVTGYLRMTVGGTLSVGGITPAYQRGAQVDAVLALEIVTPATGRVWCSPVRRSELFAAALAGLGQVGVITRVRLALEPAPVSARVYLIDHPTPEGFFADARLLLERGEVDELFCMVLPVRGGAPVYRLTVTVLTAQGAAPPVDVRVLRGLTTAPTEVTDMTYPQQVEGPTTKIDTARAQGWDDRIKPWFDMFFPDTTVERFVGPVVASLTREDFDGPPNAFVLLFPQRTDRFRSPMLRIPTGDDSRWFWLFDILTAVTDSPGLVRRMAERNQRLERRGRSLGGVLYPIGTANWTSPRWRAHYGDQWSRLSNLRRSYDPGDIMTRGVGMSSTTSDDDHALLDHA
ncbi:MAG: FAD-binding protein [Umezawaea sp.]